MKNIIFKGFIFCITFIIGFSACAPNASTIYTSSPKASTSSFQNSPTTNISTVNPLTSVTTPLPTQPASKPPTSSPLPSLVLPTLRFPLIQYSSIQVWSWGSSVSEVPGQGVSSHTPQLLNNFNDVTVISGGYSHVLAIKKDGTIWGWGENTFGQAASIMENEIGIPTQVKNISGPVDIGAGYSHSIALMSDGTVFTWGANDHGQLGNATTVSSRSPVNVVNLNSVVAIAVGQDTNLALKKDGTVWGWGEGGNGQLGTAAPGNINSKPVQINGLSSIIAIAIGNVTSLALKSDGTVWAWGLNNRGQLGDGTTKSSTIPLSVSGLTGIKAIAVGLYFCLALKNDGTVWGWGDDAYAELGNGIISNSPVFNPVQVSGLTSVSQICAGFAHGLAIKNDGSLWAWGYNDNGQLGVGNNNTSSIPIKVSGVSKVAGVTAGQRTNGALDYTLALCGQ
jgi:hypothetical protein